MKAYAINKINIAYGNQISFTTADPEFVVDVDGNEYSIIHIGEQIWMNENLRTTRYNDLEKIPQLEPGISSPPGHDGPYYNFGVAISKKICPVGWHVPSSFDIMVLINYLIANGFDYDGTTKENKIAKSLGSGVGWASSTEVGSIGNDDYPEKKNITGFSALPEGSFGFYPSFGGRGEMSGWWTSTELHSNGAYYFGLYYNSSILQTGDVPKWSAFSIRCLKDN